MNVPVPVSQNGTQRRGFTLIELLVVIAIIAILASILFPVFARARENARHASCQSNLKQMALGIFQYTQDYDEKFPSYDSVGGEGGGWSFTVQSYMRSLQILQCPSDTFQFIDNPANTYYTDYAINLGLGYPTSKSLATLTQTSSTVMLFDFVSRSSTNWSTGCNISNTCTTAGPAALWHPAGYATNARHLDGANFSYTDGHVKWSKVTISTTGGAADTINGMWNSATPGSTSGNSPTFNLSP